MLREHMGGGDDNSCQLMQSQHRDPPLVTTLEDEHNRIAPTNSQALEISGCLVALSFQLSEGGTEFNTFIVGPKQRQLIGGLCSPNIHNIVGEVEMLGNNKFQMLIVVLVGRERSLL